MSDPIAIPPILTDALAPANAAEIVESLAYALRYDQRGKPRPSGWEFMATLAAERLVEHLYKSGFVVLKAKTRPPHSAG